MSVWHVAEERIEERVTQCGRWMLAYDYRRVGGTSIAKVWSWPEGLFNGTFGRVLLPFSGGEGYRTCSI